MSQVNRAHESKGRLGKDRGVTKYYTNANILMRTIFLVLLMYTIPLGTLHFQFTPKYEYLFIMMFIYLFRFSP